MYLVYDRDPVIIFSDLQDLGVVEQFVDVGRLDRLDVEPVQVLVVGRPGQHSLQDSVHAGGHIWGYREI